MWQRVTLDDAPITQQFGVNAANYARFGLPGHNGLDLACPEGTQLYAPEDGVILEIAYDPRGYGLYIKVSAIAASWLLAHLSNTGATRLGDIVVAGTPIGLSGTTGNSTGPHVHIGYRPYESYRSTPYNGWTDPEPLLAHLT